MGVFDHREKAKSALKGTGKGGEKRVCERSELFLGERWGFWNFQKVVILNTFYVILGFRVHFLIERRLWGVLS